MSSKVDKNECRNCKWRTRLRHGSLYAIIRNDGASTIKLASCERNNSNIPIWLGIAKGMDLSDSPSKSGFPSGLLHIKIGTRGEIQYGEEVLIGADPVRKKRNFVDVV